MAEVILFWSRVKIFGWNITAAGNSSSRCGPPGTSGGNGVVEVLSTGPAQPSNIYQPIDPSWLSSSSTALPFELITLKYSCTTSSSLGSRGLPIRKYSNSASKPPRIDVLSEVYSKEKSWKIFAPPSKSWRDVVQVRMCHFERNSLYTVIVRIFFLAMIFFVIPVTILIINPTSSWSCYWTCGGGMKWISCNIFLILCLYFVFALCSLHPIMLIAKTLNVLCLQLWIGRQ